MIDCCTHVDSFLEDAISATGPVLVHLISIDKLISAILYYWCLCGYDSTPNYKCLFPGVSLYPAVQSWQPLEDRLFDIDCNVFSLKMSWLGLVWRTSPTQDSADIDTTQDGRHNSSHLSQVQDSSFGYVDPQMAGHPIWSSSINRQVSNPQFEKIQNQPLILCYIV